MRAKEFISEINTKRKPMRKNMKAAASNLTSYDQLDNNNRPYLAYRFGIALAGSPDEGMYPRGPIGSNFNMVDYSDGDTEIRKGAEKIMGITPSSDTGKGSKETKDTNTVSPVANWNKK